MLWSVLPAATYRTPVTDQGLSSGWWLQRGKDHREDKWEKSEMETEKSGGLQRFKVLESLHTWFWFELSVFCHVGESVSHKVMYNTPLITFWPARTPHCAFPPPLPSPSILVLYARGVQTQASKETIQPGFQFSQAFTKASGNRPDLPGRSENPGWFAAPEAWALTTQLNANRNHAIFFPRVKLEMWRNPKKTGDSWLISGADRYSACLNYWLRIAHLYISVKFPRQLLFVRVK